MVSTPNKNESLFHATSIHGGVGNYQPGECFGPRRLHDFELVWIAAGSAVYQHGHQQHELSIGDLQLARPGFWERYQWDNRHRSRHGFVHFEMASFPADWPGPDVWPVVCPPGRAAAGGVLFEQLLASVFDRPNGSGHAAAAPLPKEQRLLACIIDFFIAPMTPDSGHSMPSEPLDRALNLMAAHITRRADQPIVLDHLAKAACVSPTHLIRLFRRNLGITPMTAVRLARLDKAVLLLDRSNLNMSEIADRCGFASPYHFSRLFTAQFGQAPSALRRALRGGGQPPPRQFPEITALLAHRL